MPTLWHTFKKETVNLPFIGFSFSVAIIYLICSLYVMNYRLVMQTILGGYSLTFKVTLLSNLLLGLFTTYTRAELFFMIFNSMFVGINIVFIVRSFRKLRSQGETVKLSIGGATLLSFVTGAGCSTCGLSILSLLGISTSFSFLPFKGLEIHIIASITLILSFIYMLRHLHKDVYCMIPEDQTD